MIADLAKQKGMKWSPYKGLVNRETNELVSNNLDEIAKELLGPNAGAADLGSVESIVKANPAAQEVVDKYEGPDSPNPVWQAKKIAVEATGYATLEDKQLDRIKQLSGNMLNSVRML
jgi:hypothetical protein